MWITRCSILLALGLLANVLWNGAGCWGRSPGGFASMLIYGSQLALAALGSIVAVIAVIRADLPGARRRALWIGFCAVGSAVLFVLFGWAAFTSMHYQAPWSLIAFGGAFFTGIVAGVSVERTKQGGQRL